VRLNGLNGERQGKRRRGWSGETWIGSAEDEGFELVGELAWQRRRGRGSCELGHELCAVSPPVRAATIVPPSRMRHVLIVVAGVEVHRQHELPGIGEVDRILCLGLCRERAGNSSDARIAMMGMTTRSSMRVKACGGRAASVSIRDGRLVIATASWRLWRFPCVLKPSCVKPAL
jgi:hypothetical protein